MLAWFMRNLHCPTEKKMPDFPRLPKFALFLLIAILSAASNAQAKTIMWLEDEFTGAGSNVDTVISTPSVYIPNYGAGGTGGGGYYLSRAA